MAKNKYTLCYSKKMIMIIAVSLMLFPIMGWAQNGPPKSEFGLYLYGSYDIDTEIPGTGAMIDYKFFISNTISVGPFIHGIYLFEKDEIEGSTVSVSGTLGYYNLDAGGKIDIGLSDDFYIWAGLGASYSTAIAEFAITVGGSTGSDTVTDSKFGLAAISGLEYKLSNGISVLSHAYYNTHSEALVVGGGIRFKF